MSWKQALRERSVLFFGTSSKKGTPRVIPVVSLGMIDDQLLIGACLMGVSLKNLLENPQVSIVVKEDDAYFRIQGKVRLYKKGSYFDTAVAKSNPPLPKAALLVTIHEVVDINTGKRML